MSFAHDRTFELWRSFMPERNSIKHGVSTDLFSLQVYEAAHDFTFLNPAAEFENWAAKEVSDFADVPAGMEAFTLSGGLYAVFLHKGAAATGPETFRYIFGSWLPHSGYELDNRPHFEILGPKYKNNDPASEEDIWIPIRKKV